MPPCTLNTDTSEHALRILIHAGAMHLMHVTARCCATGEASEGGLAAGMECGRQWIEQWNDNAVGLINRSLTLACFVGFAEPTPRLDS